jgi:hypothetical protein
MMPDLDSTRRMVQDHCAGWTNRPQITDRAARFMSGFLDLISRLDGNLLADHPMIYALTFECGHKETRNYVCFSGWKE